MRETPFTGRGFVLIEEDGEVRQRQSGSSVERDVAAMAEQQISVNRTLVGVIAAACLVAGVAIGFLDEFTNLWCAAFIRVGLVMGALWIALPTRDRKAAWANVSPVTLVAVLAVAVMLAGRPRVFFPLLVVAAILWFFVRPRRSTRTRPPQRDGRR